MTILAGTSAFADGSTSPLNGSIILNSQTQLHTVESNVSTEAMNVNTGDFAAQSIAGGNAVDITTMQDTNVTNSQYTSSIDIGASLSANVKNVYGDATLSSQAFCNNASVSTDPTTTVVYSQQECQAQDPSASLSATVQNVGGGLSSSAVSLGNNFEEDTNAPNAPVQNYQLNASNVSAINNTNAYNVQGSVSIVGQAIGNNAQIVHYNIGN
ncbi:MAG TPA: hypothetical protein VGG10_23070 [Rhizomicrobium sp.]|jgi:hypothetical protein